jgi:hypothetical protein
MVAADIEAMSLGTAFALNNETNRCACQCPKPLVSHELQKSKLFPFRFCIA